MKRKSGFIRKLTSRLLATVLIILLLIGGFYGVKGYIMYQNAINEAPIVEIVNTIQGQENYVKYEDLLSIYIDAVISTEDKRFETHCGIDILAICRAAWTDIKTLSFAEGGSTITQQIAKNQLFTQEKRVERKFAEVFAAFAFEKEYSKKELFEIYVNSIYFGDGYYGIYDAAQSYYGKSPSNLTDYEAIMLAGIPNAPSAYSPDTNEEFASQRVKQVLNSMVQNHIITQEEADRIEREDNSY
jgi:monofunctional glycosyltransferase